jgi:hypothetical protein
MAVYETFSKRKRRLERTGQQDVYQYDVLPEAFRVQVIHIWNSAIGKYRYPDFSGHKPPLSEVWDFIHNAIAREIGVFRLGRDSYDANSETRCKEHLLTADTEGALDIIELSFRLIDTSVRRLQHYTRQEAEITQDSDDAIEELNHRFREHGIGYQYVARELVRIDSQVIHAEAVKPALSLLNESGFDGPAEEFMLGFEHYRHGRNKEAIAEALKAFESTMKAICKARNWTHPPNATAKPLTDFLFQKGLIPADLESHFSGLRSAMESGLPTISNRTSRHGQGPDPVAIPDHFAAYALHLAASNIVFLIKAHKSLR